MLETASTRKRLFNHGKENVPPMLRRNEARRVCPSAPAKCAPWHRKRCLVEEKIYPLLQRLLPPVRRSLLARHFTQAQRLALERWILLERDQSLEPTHSGAVAFRPSTVAKLCRQVAGSKTSRVDGRCTRAKALPTRHSEAFGLHTHRRPDTLIYRASVVAGPFRITTGSSANLEKVRHYLQVLLRIRERVRSAVDQLQCSHAGIPCGPPSGRQALEECFRAAVLEEPKEVLADADNGMSNLRLYFYATVPANYWIGRPLTTPSFPVATGLDQGLRSWRRLNEACGPVCERPNDEELRNIWAGLCQAHLENLAEAAVLRRGQHVPEELARAAMKLEALELRHRKRRQHHDGRLSAKRAFRRLTTNAFHGARQGQSGARNAKSDTCISASLTSATGQVPPVVAERQVLALLAHWTPTSGRVCYH